MQCSMYAKWMANCSRFNMPGGQLGIAMSRRRPVGGGGEGGMVLRMCGRGVVRMDSLPVIFLGTCRHGDGGIVCSVAFVVTGWRNGKVDSTFSIHIRLRRGLACCTCPGYDISFRRAFSGVEVGAGGGGRGCQASGCHPAALSLCLRCKPV